MEGSIGQRAGRRPTLRRMLAALLGLSAGLLLLRLGSKDVWEASEGRPLESAREMRERGDRLVQVTNGAVDLTKPPLYAWAAEASFAIAGRDSEAAGRVPSVLAALGVLAGVAVLGARIAGPRAGFLAGFALLTTAKFLWQARLAELETFLALGVIWAYVAFDAALDATSGARRLALYATSFAATGFGFAVKGPIALLLVLPGSLAYALVTRRLRQVLASPAFWAALPAMAIIGLPWYAAVVSRDPSALDVLLSFARAENVGHLRDPSYYLLTYPLYALPWTPLVVAGLRMRWTLDLPPTSSRRARLPLVAFGVTFVLLSLLPTKQTHYLIPVVFPMGAVLAGSWLDRRLAAKAPRASFSDVLRTAVPCMGLVLLADVLFRPADDASSIVTVASSLVVALAVLWFLARRMGFAWTPVSKVEAAMVLLLALEAFGVGWVVPRFNARQSSREFFEGVAHDVPRGAPLAWTVFGSHSDYLWHLPMSVVTRDGIPELVGHDDAETVARLRSFLAGGGPRYAIVTMAQARALGDEVVVLRREPSLQKKGRDVALVRTTGG